MERNFLWTQRKLISAAGKVLGLETQQRFWHFDLLGPYTDINFDTRNESYELLGFGHPYTDMPVWQVPGSGQRPECQYDREI